MSPLYKMNAGEFARRLRRDSEMPDKRFAFFLGAGCSISSGIPGASSLVKDFWLPQLREFCAPDGKNVDEWIKEEFPDYDPANPASSYGRVLERLFLNAEDRQREIERLCDGKFPGFGYAVLATLIAKYGGSFNVVITTNFDDLMSDALYLFTRARPLVIGHESLAGYIRPTRTRPLVVKIHGDARLSPQNTIAETSIIQKEVERQVNVLLHDRALIFIGYGGNDKGIATMLSDLPKDALPFGVYWVSESEPQGVLRTWLEERKAIWVEKFDFDEMMLLIRDAFDLPHPDMKQVESVFQLYGATYEKLSGRIRSAPAEKADDSLKKAVERADSDLTGWLAYHRNADKLKEKDPEQADRMYQEGIEKYPQSAPLISNYALFLKNIRKDYEKAEQHYLRAIETNPNSATSLSNYAFFLANIRKDYDKADQFYMRALEADPKVANTLSHYATFLEEVRKDHEKAEQFYLRAIEANPNQAATLNNYALFLESIRKDYDKAEQFYLRAIEGDPNDANTLGNYAVFLESIRKDYDKAEQFYLRAIEVNSKDDTILHNYALFLESIRKDYDQAEQFYLRAIEVNPNDANTLGSYASLALSLGHKEQGLSLLDQAISLLPAQENRGLVTKLWFYAFCHWPENKGREALRNLKIALLGGERSPGSNLDPNIERARQDDHPDIRWIEILADVITNDADINQLDAWDKWREA